MKYMIPGYKNIADFCRIQNMPHTTVARQMKNGFCNWPRIQMDGDTKDSAYKCWENMIQRGTNPNATKAHLYYERGITVCIRWQLSFKWFLEDMGPRPSSRHSIDRIDVNGNYEPGNCRWATYEEQAANTRKPPGCLFHDKKRNRWLVKFTVDPVSKFFKNQEEAEEFINQERVRRAELKRA